MTGVQTCALPISVEIETHARAVLVGSEVDVYGEVGERLARAADYVEIGRASCRERV